MNDISVNINTEHILAPGLCIEEDGVHIYEDKCINVLQCTFTAMWEEEMEFKGRMFSEAKESMIAQMELRVITAEDIEDILDYADASDADSCAYAMAAQEYIKKETLLTDKVTLCALHRLYISPKWRGKGYSKKILYSLPSILYSSLNIENAYIVVQINPFRDQNGELDDGFNAFHCCDYAGNQTEEEFNNDIHPSIPEELYKTLEAPLLKCGFTQMKSNTNYYAADISSINDAATRFGFGQAWENEDF